jgi:hypothetical protein
MNLLKLVFNLEVFQLFKSNAEDPVGEYGCECTCRVTQDITVCADKYSLHFLPVGSEQIDGSPGIKVTLGMLVSAGCAGFLFASSRINPLISEEGNVGNRQTYLFLRNFGNFGSLPIFSEISRYIPIFPKLSEDFLTTSTDFGPIPNIIYDTDFFYRGCS